MKLNGTRQPAPTVPRRIDKPWGHELVWAETEHYAGKILHVDAGCQLSLQVHRRKDESIYVMEGEIEVDVVCPETAPTTLRLGPGQAFRVRPGMQHRFRALVASAVLEVSTPELDDVERLEDDYGRAPIADVR